MDEDYCYFESDDEAQNDSSEDDLDIMLHGTPEQKRKMRKSIEGSRLPKTDDDSSSSSEDDFEKAMEAELSKTMRDIQGRNSLGEPPPQSSSQSASGSTGTEPQPDQKTQPKSAAEDFYDDDYFDSDSDDGSANKKGKKKHPKMTNEDLLYDPGLDDADQKWVDTQRINFHKYFDGQRGGRRGGASGTNRGRDNRNGPLPNTDAVLNCPACMVTLCRDCQRHELFQHQYRAMFVSNVKVDKTETLKYPVVAEQSKKSMKKNKRKRKLEQESATESPAATETENPEDVYHPVKCTECNTLVAVFDQDEVYHFFNVLTSH